MFSDPVPRARVSSQWNTLGTPPAFPIYKNRSSANTRKIKAYLSPTRRKRRTKSYFVHSFKQHPPVTISICA